METKKYKNSYLVFFILGFIAAVFFEFYWINNFPYDYFMLIGIGLLVLITGYLSFDGIIKTVNEAAEERREQNEIMIKAQKAIYLATKKNSAEAENMQLQNLKAVSLLMDRMVDTITEKQLEAKNAVSQPADLSGLINELTQSNARLAKELQNAVTVSQLVKANEDLVKNVQSMLNGNSVTASSSNTTAPVNADTAIAAFNEADIPADIFIPDETAVPAADIAVSTENMAASAGNMTTSAANMAVSAEDMSTFAENMAVSTEDMAASAVDMAVSTENMAVSTGDMSASAGDMTASAMDMPFFDGQDIFDEAAYAEEDITVEEAAASDETDISDDNYVNDEEDTINIDDMTLEELDDIGLADSTIDADIAGAEAAVADVSQTIEAIEAASDLENSITDEDIALTDDISLSNDSDLIDDNHITDDSDTTDDNAITDNNNTIGDNDITGSTAIADNIDMADDAGVTDDADSDSTLSEAVSATEKGPNDMMTPEEIAALFSSL